MATDGSAILAVPPGLLMVAAAALLPFLRGRARSTLLLLAPLATLVWIWLLPEETSGALLWLQLELVPVRIDGLGRLFATAFGIMAFVGGLFALRQERTVELSAALAYGGASVGVVLAGDLVTLFVFWEAMAVASTLIVLSGGEGARRAAQRYIVIHLLGGVLLMAGIAGEVTATGSIGFSGMAPDSVARWLILAAFLLNAGAPPLSAWVPDAYPRASWSGTVFLSAFTTKAAVYAILRGFPGADILIPVGLVMVFYGLVYAVLENDSRRKLAYSIVNQVGFMVTAIGIGSPMALNGAAAHAFVHILYKALLLMSAGSVLYVTGRSKFSELGGLFRTMPVTAACCIIGALSISAFPFTSGFPAKSLIAEGAAEAGQTAAWYLIAAGSAGVLFVGIKLPWYLFFERDSGLRPPEPPRSMRLAMILVAALCIAIGVAPQTFYELLPYPVAYEPNSFGHVVWQLELLLASGLAFLLLLPFLKRTSTITLDVDRLWRRRGTVARSAHGPRGPAVQRWREAGRDIIALLAVAFRGGADAETAAARWPSGRMALVATAILGASLALYYW